MNRIAVAIPSYKVQNHVLDVIARIPPQVERIYVVAARVKVVAA